MKYKTFFKFFPILKIENPLKAIATFLILLMNWLDFGIYMIERGVSAALIDKTYRKTRMNRKHNKKSIGLSQTSKKLTSAGKARPKNLSKSKNESSSAKAGNSIILENPSTSWV